MGVPMVPTVSVTELYAPKTAKTKSFASVVESPETVGVPALVAHVELTGRLTLGSKGETVFAPDTANSAPLAAVGGPLSVTVMMSEESVVEDIPYHSIWVVSCALVHSTFDALAELCQVTPPRESEIVETVIEEP